MVSCYSFSTHAVGGNSRILLAAAFDSSLLMTNTTICNDEISLQQLISSQTYCGWDENKQCFLAEQRQYLGRILLVHTH